MEQSLPDYEERITAVMMTMTNADKVGQVVMGEIKSLTPDKAREFRIGGVLNGGGSFPNNKENSTAQDWRNLSQSYHAKSIERVAGNSPQTPIPILWGTDAVHGHNNLVGATLFPHNIGLGATRNAELMKEIGQVVAREMAASGIFWTFAPTIAVPQNDRWGRTYEGLSEDPAVVATLGAALVDGLQGEFSTSAPAIATDRVAATAKHFIGDGGTLNGQDTGNTVITEQALRDIHGEAYVKALQENVLVVMASFSQWNGDQLHGHKYLLTDVLKGRMGFQGFVLGDWNGHGRVPGCSSAQCAAAINAGVDMIMVPNDWEALYRNTLSAVNAGTITQARLDEAVRRILRVKFILGLFDGQTPMTRTGSGQNNVIGSASHRAVARQAVRESLVLLKNNNDVLPIASTAKVLVVGSSSQQIWAANGGWSVSWQGGNSNNSFPGATSIYNGIREAATAGGGSVAYSANGVYEETPDVAVVFFAEESYAEGAGDRARLELRGNTLEPSSVRLPAESTSTRINILNKLRGDGIPVVSVYMGGRPLWLTNEINASEAFVAAWLPGTEGGGVADVLFCDMSAESDCDFKGTLPYSWPRTAVDFIQNVNQPGYNPQFEVGYGLTYSGDAPNIATIGPDTPATVTPTISVLGTRLFQGEVSSRAYKLELQSPAGTEAFAKPGNGTTDGVVQTRVVDRAVQEDAQIVTFAGGRNGAWRLSNATTTATDLSTEPAGGAVLITVRVDKAGRAPMLYSLLCGEGCQASTDISDVLRDKVGEDWFELAVPFSCLTKMGADLSKVSAPVIMHTSGRWTVGLSDISYDMPTLDAVRLRCN